MNIITLREAANIIKPTEYFVETELRPHGFECLTRSVWDGSMLPQLVESGEVTGKRLERQGVIANTVRAACAASGISEDAFARNCRDYLTDPLI